jgi:membrane-bound lytic murein transglycosylase B
VVIRVATALLALSLVSTASGQATPGSPASATASAAAPVATPATPPSNETADQSHFDVTSADIRAYIEEAAAEGLNRSEVTALLAAAAPQPKIIEAMTRPAEKTLQWWEYRARLITPLRIQGGVELWLEHKELLDQVALEYRVPPQYVVAVVGIETLYGQRTGRYRVLDALATLAFEYPPRAPYFRRQLTEFLLLSREDGLDPLTVRGSYAGAMGALQFMPSSYRKFAVSEAHEPHRDLWGNWGDIFASTANYLHEAGWRYGAPVLIEAQLVPAATVTPAEHMTLNETLGSLRARGVTLATTLPDATPVLLLAAPQADAMSYRVGFQNFYVLTRYNSSPLYAMAVHDLAQAIWEQMAEETAP